MKRLYKQLGLFLFCFGAVVPVLDASVAGVLEDFEGLDDFDEFHSSDWIVAGEEELGVRNGKLEFSSPREVESFSALIRGISGAGSFRSAFEFESVLLEDPFSTITIAHSLGGNRGGLAFSLRNRDNVSPDAWVVSITAGAGVFFESEVPQSTSGNVRLELHYQAESKLFVAMYDPDHTDEIAPLEFEATYGSSVAAEGHRFELSIGSVQDAESFAALDFLSIVPTDGRVGDFSGDDMLDAADIVMLLRALRIDGIDAIYDLNGDTVFDVGDAEMWVQAIYGTYFGDANLDGEFASADLVNVFAAGEYEDGIELNSTWSTGDWDGDGDFTTSDLVLAFQDGGYEQGPRVAASVPEPTGLLAPLLVLIWLAQRRFVGAQPSWARRRSVCGREPSAKVVPVLETSRNR